jgi:hypothetical protein
MVAVIHCLKPSPDFKQKLGGTNERPNSKARQAMNPAILCAIIGVLLLVGIGIHLKLEADKDFPGRPWAEDFIKLNDHMTGAELEPTESRAGDLADNLMLRGFDVDDFSLPSEISSQQAAGWRVFRHGPSGHKVVQIAIDLNSSIVFVFRTSDFGVQPGTEWRIFEHEGWAAAIRQFHGLCVLVTFRGSESEMRNMIQSLQQP